MTNSDFIKNKPKGTKLRLVLSHILLIDQERIMSDSEIFPSEDEEDCKPETIWLTKDEFENNLPSLLRGTARRKKTMESLFPHLSNQVYRCSEFPNGIYINDFGELCPKDSKSGVYQQIPPEEEDDFLVDEELTEDEDNDNAADSDDAHWEEEENKKKKRKRRIGSDDEEDYDNDDDDEESESSDMESADDDVIIDIEEDDDWQPRTKKRKVKVTISESEEDSDLILDSHGYEIEPDIAPSHDEQDRGVPLAGLSQVSAQMEHLQALEQQKRVERLKSQKLIKYLEDFIEEWNMQRKKYHKLSKSELKVNPKNMTLKMTYDSALFNHPPSCNFTFQKPAHEQTTSASLVCTEPFHVLCECGESFLGRPTSDIYKHMEQHVAM